MSYVNVCCLTTSSNTVLFVLIVDGTVYDLGLVILNSRLRLQVDVCRNLQYVILLNEMICTQLGVSVQTVYMCGLWRLVSGASVEVV